jgi:hypothetical protein
MAERLLEVERNVVLLEGIYNRIVLFTRVEKSVCVIVLKYLSFSNF